ncbi:hypothetical protein IE4803_PD00078 (plasmid) [Rhizobium etli bv. phaseoli str. IE4803]|nr:hypothetical protein IE4803_PD00078 [Rhizobium etli bv. phaseoli str. IE4803]
MCQCTKKLADAVTMTGFPTKSGSPVGKSRTHGLSGILNRCEFGILFKARKNANAGIGYNKLESAFTDSISDKSRFDTLAMGIDVILQFPQGSKQPFNEAARKIMARSRVFGMLGPLIPARLVVTGRIVQGKGKDAGNVTHSSAGYEALIERLIDHCHKSWLKRDCFVGIRIAAPRHRKLNQRANPAGTTYANISELRKSLGSRLPKQIVCIFKAAFNLARCLHAVPAIPSMHLPDAKRGPGASCANAGNRPVTQSDKMNQPQIVQYWRENFTRAIRNGFNSAPLPRNRALKSSFRIARS